MPSLVCIFFSTHKTGMPCLVYISRLTKQICPVWYIFLNTQDRYAQFDMLFQTHKAGMPSLVYFSRQTRQICPVYSTFFKHETQICQVLHTFLYVQDKYAQFSILFPTHKTGMHSLVYFSRHTDRYAQFRILFYTHNTVISSFV